MVAKARKPLNEKKYAEKKMLAHEEGDKISQIEYSPHAVIVRHEDNVIIEIVNIPLNKNDGLWILWHGINDCGAVPKMKIVKVRKRGPAGWYYVKVHLLNFEEIKEIATSEKCK